MDVDLLKSLTTEAQASTSEKLLKLATPTESVISVGRSNISRTTRILPVLARLASFGIPVHMTSKEGTITYASDGQHWVRIETGAQTPRKTLEASSCIGIRRPQTNGLFGERIPMEREFNHRGGARCFAEWMKQGAGRWQDPLSPPLWFFVIANCFGLHGTPKAMSPTARETFLFSGSRGTRVCDSRVQPKRD